MRLTLPVINAVGTQDMMDTIAYLNLGMVTDQLVHCSPFPDFVVKCVDKLLLSLHGISVSHKTLAANKELSGLGAIVNGRDISIDCISCNSLMMMIDIQCRKG